MIRDINIFRYPEGVSVEEGEKWLLGTHVHEVKTIPGVRKFYTWKVLNYPERPSQMVRMTETWWDDIESWKQYWPNRFEWVKTRAPWGGIPPTVGEAIFVDERPEYDLMVDIPEI